MTSTQTTTKFQDTLKLMKSPRDRRPSIWRQGVLQIHIGRACDKACFGCTQGSNLGGKPVIMTAEQFDVACQSLAGYWGVVGVFGGNPCINPYFEEICKVMRGRIPYEQRGLWSNHPKGKADHCRITFNPKVSNLNVHLDQEAYDEFARDWPECRGELKGLTQDSRHSPVYVAMKDVIEDENEILDLIGKCDVNQYWSAMICVFRGELRGYFCEIAGAQAMLHQNEPDYPDLGVKIEPGWWDKSMEAFQEQVKYHCFSCGFPLKGKGELAITGTTEQVSKTHESIYKPKTKGREVQLVTLRSEVKEKALVRGTDYIENGVKV